MIHIFLPAYNEAIALPILVAKFAKELSTSPEPFRILVLDDGSRDGTTEAAQDLAKRYPLDVLKHETNQGLGQTMRDGFKHLARIASDEDWIVSLDCDDTHEPKYLKDALGKAKTGYDLVILSRFVEGGGQEGLSWFKTFLSRGAGLFLKIFFPIKGVKEYSCNYRVYRARIVKKAVQTFGDDFIRLADLGFVATAEVLVKMRMLGARIGESPFVLRYDQKPSPSKNRPLRTIRGYFALVWNFWGRRI